MWVKRSGRHDVVLTDKAQEEGCLYLSMDSPGFGRLLAIKLTVDLSLGHMRPFSWTILLLRYRLTGDTLTVLATLTPKDRF